MDKNNFGPRLGVAWTLGSDKRTVLRASTGLMYDQPLLAAYENAVQQNGVRSVTVSLTPSSRRRAGVPGRAERRRRASRCGPRASSTVDPEFKPGRTFQNNIQIDRALGQNYSAQVGFIYVKGYNLPVINDINLINPVGTLADGRPIFSSSRQRRDPRWTRASTTSTPCSRSATPPTRA